MTGAKLSGVGNPWNGKVVDGCECRHCFLFYRAGRGHLVADEAPVWEMPGAGGTVVNVREGEEGRSLLFLEAQDPENDTLEFRVDHPYFSLNGTQLQTATAIDFEATPAISVPLM